RILGPPIADQVEDLARELAGKHPRSMESGHALLPMGAAAEPDLADEAHPRVRPTRVPSFARILAECDIAVWLWRSLPGEEFVECASGSREARGKWDDRHRTSVN